jgi:DtxR family transcriptional regulator, manganese transport regulator
MKKSSPPKTKRSGPVSKSQQAAMEPNSTGEHNPFAAARRDHSSETAEDYVEEVARINSELGQCRVVDLARKFAVSSVTVNRTIARLKRDGWVDAEPYGPVLLTEAGKQLAERCRLRHETVRNFLLSLGVPAAIAEIDTEGIEHHVSPETLQAMAKHTRQAPQASGTNRSPRAPKRRTLTGE